MNTNMFNESGSSEPQMHQSEALPHSFGANASAANGSAPPYTAPYPPYLTAETPVTGAISVPVASGLAYFTVIPAIFFLLLEPYRSNATVRFHSWQSIFYFLLLAAVRAVESLMVAVLPSALAFTVSALLSLALFAGWLVATIKAFQGTKTHLPYIGKYAEATANTRSVRY